MDCWLMFSNGSEGFVCKVQEIDCYKHLDATSIDTVDVPAASVNQVKSGPLAHSAMSGGVVALRVLSREYRDLRSMRLVFETEPINIPVAGKSADLLFALATFLYIANDKQYATFPHPIFAATGKVDPDGNVGPIRDLPLKIVAALAPEALPAGGTIFFPRTNIDEVDDDLKILAAERQIKLVPVERIEQALEHLGIKTKGWWDSNKRPPYPGLKAFGVDDSPIFFGRESDVAKFIEILTQREKDGQPGAMVMAESGSGKSSFVAAGVIAALKLRQPDKALEYAIWRPSQTKPSTDALIDETLLAHSIHFNWAESTPEEPGQGFRGARKAPPPGKLEDLAKLLQNTGLARRRLIWVIDQFEELFTLAVDKQARIAIGKFVLRLQALGVWVIFTMRGEFFVDYQTFNDENGNPLLFDAFPPKFNLQTMHPENLYSVIVGPADVAGLKFETRGLDRVRLDEVIKTDLADIDNPLPLLGYALNELFIRRQQDQPDENERKAFAPTLTFAAFEKIGRIKGAIGTVANTRYEEFTNKYNLTEEKSLETLANVLDALAVPNTWKGGETAIPADLTQWSEESLERQLIDELVDIRILTTSLDDNQERKLLRVAHEALFTHWDKAVLALAKTRIERAIANGFRSRAQEWKKSDSKSLLLASISDIEDARKIQPWLKTESHNVELSEFVYASIQKFEQAKQRRRWTNSSIMAILSILLGFAVYYGLRATKESIRASNAETEAIAVLAHLRIENGDSISGLLTGISNISEPLTEPLNANLEASLLRALLTNKEVKQLKGHVQRVTDLRVSSDGTQLLTLSKTDAVEIRPLSDPDKTGLIISGDVPVRAAEFFANGTKILTESANVLRIWTHNGTLLDSIKTNDGVHIQAVSADGAKLLLSSRSGRHELRSLVAPTLPPYEINHPGTLRDAEFSADGKLLATISSDGRAIVWTVGESRRPNARTILPSGKGEAVHYGEAVRFSPDNKWIAAAFDDGSVFLCKTDFAPSACQLLPIDKGHISLAFAPDSSELAAVSSSNIARSSNVYSWKLDNAAGIRMNIALKSRSGQIGYMNDGGTQLVVSSTEDNVIYVFNRSSGIVTKVIAAGPLEQVLRVAFIPHSANLVTAATDGIVRLWDLSSRQTRQTVLQDANRNLDNARFVDDSKVEALDSADRILRWEIEVPISRTFSATTINGANWVPSQIRTVPTTRTNASEPFSLPPACAIGTATESHEFKDPSGTFTAKLKSPRELEIQSKSQNDAPPRIFPHSATVRCVLFGKNGKLATASDDHAIRVWNIYDQEQAPLVLLGHMGGIADLYFDNQSQRLASASEDKTARLWFLNGAQTSSIVLEGHADPLKRVKFSPSGSRLLTTSWDGSVRIWDTPTGKALIEAAQNAVTRCTSNSQAKVLGISSTFTEGINRRVDHICPVGAPTTVDHP